MNQWVMNQGLPSLLGGGWTVFPALFVMWLVVKHIRIVPQQTAFIVERPGKYNATFYAGPHILSCFT